LAFVSGGSMVASWVVRSVERTASVSAAKTAARRVVVKALT